MENCKTDPSIERLIVAGFPFPLGVYPVEPMVPVAGYASEFEPADGDDESGDWEAWPDRYVYDIVVPSTRLEAFWQQLFALMPGRVFPIMDYIGHDEFREIDPYIAYEPVGKERVTNILRQYRPFFLEDGMVGFGAVSEDPFFYAFVDEHKILTVRVSPEDKPKIDKLLAAFDISQVNEPAGADAAAHEHRSVMLMPEDHPELLGPDEIVERVRDEWQLILNVDPDTNLDEDDQEIGLSIWRTLARVASEQNPNDTYCEVFLVANCIRRAEELTQIGIDSISPDSGNWLDIVVVNANRISKETLEQLAATKDHLKPLLKKDLETEQILCTTLLGSETP